MNLKRLGVLFLFLDFAAFTAWVVVTQPLGAVADAVRASYWTVQIAIDLVIALSFGAVWLARDAKARGMNPLPWIVALPFTGSLSLLAYLLLRREHGAEPALRPVNA